VLFNSIAQQTRPISPIELVIIDELAHHRMQVSSSPFIATNFPAVPTCSQPCLGSTIMLKCVPPESLPMR
jgi:hypothetical protein